MLETDLNLVKEEIAKLEADIKNKANTQEQKYIQEVSQLCKYEHLKDLYNKVVPALHTMQGILT